MAITAGAAALRLLELGSQPGGLYPDEAAEGWDAWRLLHEAGFHPLFFGDDGGREPLFAYLCAGVFRIFGASVTSLRSFSAVLGVIAVLALLPALWRYGRVAALCGSAWAAGSVWQVSVSRDGMRNMLVPLCGALAMWALLRWMGEPRRRTALVAGAVCGLGLWTYQPLKLLPLLVLVWLVVLRHTDAVRRCLPSLRAGAVAYGVVAAPMLWVAVTDPRSFFGRGLSVVANPGDNEGVVVHTVRTLGMFGITGDPNQRHDVDALPLIAPVLAALLAVGVVLAWRRRGQPEYALLLCGLVVMLLPALVALEGSSPHGLRTLGMVPYVAGLIGVGAQAAVLRVRRAGAVLAVVLFALLAVHTAAVYFSRDVTARYDAYAMELTAMAQAARPGDVVILDDYSAPVLLFIDSAAPPQVAAPGTVVQVARGGSVYALQRGQLQAALGADAAARAQVVATRPDGSPAVWRTTP